MLERGRGGQSVLSAGYACVTDLDGLMALGIRRLDPTGIDKNRQSSVHPADSPGVHGVAVQLSSIASATIKFLAPRRTPSPWHGLVLPSAAGTSRRPHGFPEGIIRRRRRRSATHAAPKAPGRSGPDSRRGTSSPDYWSCRPACRAFRPTRPSRPLLHPARLCIEGHRGFAATVELHLAVA
jgi:hypothetical protein